MKKIALLVFILVIPILFLYSFQTNLKQLPFKIKPLIPKGDRTWYLWEELSQSWNLAENAWENDDKAIYYYNVVNPARIDSVRGFHYDDGLWEWTSTTFLTYLPGTNLVSFIEMKYVFGAMIFSFVKAYATYDNQNRLTLYHMTMYNMGTSTFDTMIRQHFIYGANNTVTVYMFYPASGPDPAEYNKHSFNYDGNGRVIYELHQVSSDSTSWSNDRQVHRNYHPNDTTTGAQIIANIANSMMMYLGFSGNQGFFGMVSDEVEEDWESNAWVNSEKHIYSYDNQNRLITMLEQDWNGAAWINNYKEEYVYDGNGNVHTKTDTDWENNSWVNDEKSIYTWGQGISTEDNVSPVFTDLALSVYPNPCSGNLQMHILSKTNESATMRIYNLKGQLVQTINAKTNQTVVWDGRNMHNSICAPGIYLVKATTGRKSVTQRFIRLH